MSQDNQQMFLAKIATSLVLLLNSIFLPNSIAIARQQEAATLQKRQSERYPNSHETKENALQKSISLYHRQHFRSDSPLVQTPIISSEFPEAESQVLITELVIEGTNDPELLEAIYRVIKTQAGQKTTRSLLQEDVKAIFTTGYFANVTVVPEDTPSGVRVTFQVEPNPILNRVVVRTIPERQGEQVLPQEKVDEIFEEQYGQIVNLRDFQAGILELNEWYREQGYDLAQVVGAPKVSQDGTVTIDVAEGVIEEVRIRFLNEENESVEGYTSDLILQQIEQKAGDVFNREIAQKDLERTFGLGLFNDVRFSFSVGSDPSQVIVSIDVEEFGSILDIAHTLREQHNKESNPQLRQKALSLYQQALQDYQLKEDTVGQALALTGIADVYRELKNFEQALSFYNRALLLWRANMAQLDESKFNYKEYTESVSWGTGVSSLQGIFADAHGFVSFRGNELATLINLSSLYRLLGNYQQSLDSLNEAKLISQNHGANILEAFEKINNSENLSTQEKEKLRFVIMSFLISGDWFEGLMNYGTSLVYSDLEQLEQSLDYRRRGLVQLKNGFGDFCGILKSLENNNPESNSEVDYLCNEFFPLVFKNAEDGEKLDFELFERLLRLLYSLPDESNITSPPSRS
ncbi:tetratricopeptide repeat protein [Lusitaniella coriacea LEGE 07157]|uniref:Tetratricopeptide repeat protein n=1 Tax=Lusitaniella coriacea LEGE 07157 TaxID=945747 RepID=A0A8J7E6F4_9CYAN|nr:POTRA domain-containing protein [Lusitaniella coriacea]MBE9119129.1 tetratricopeptide repeat protein [Lusitaniella coriacea LEGE 07157]